MTPYETFASSINSRIADPAGLVRPIFSVQDHAAGRYVREPRCWAHGTLAGDANSDGRVNALDFNAVASHYGQSGGRIEGDANADGAINALDFNAVAMNFGKLPSRIDLTPISPWNSGGGIVGGGMFVTPINYLFATHVGSGDIVRAVTLDNRTIERKILRVDAVPGEQFDYRISGTDISCAMLDAPILESDLRPIKLLPIDWQTAMPNTYSLPILWTDTQEEAQLGDALQLVGKGWYAGNLTFGNRALFREPSEWNGSGNSATLVWINELVALGHVTYGYAAGGTRLVAGPSYAFYRPGIDQTIAMQGGGYSVQSIDFNPPAANGTSPALAAARPAAVRGPVRPPTRAPFTP